MGQLVPADGSLVVYADLARIISPRFDHTEALKVAAAAATRRGAGASADAVARPRPRWPHLQLQVVGA